MYYYDIHLPLGFKRSFSYCSARPIALGARVLVSLNRKLIMGICGQAVKPKDFAYQEVIEVLDNEPVINLDLMQLGEWMAEYYLHSVGRALFAMLPAKLQVDVDAAISWIAPEVPQEFQPLHQALGELEQLPLKKIKEALPQYPVYKMAAEAETRGLALLFTRLKHKDKPKTMNYIEIIAPKYDFEKLPLRQREAWEIFQSFEPGGFAMADVSSRISYSTIKALVKKEIIRIVPRIVQSPHLRRDPAFKPKDIVLNEEQNRAIAEILEDFGHFQAHLLYGITGSGKTEVYIELMRKYLEAGRGIIFLIPEIALTPQMVDRFDSNFGDTLAIQHSQLTQAQRFDQWQKIRSGECKVIIGARSAVFAPVKNLGLIIVDEEHEQSYKQDSQPRYQGRDLAVMRAKLQNAQIVLGSATPALESWNNASLGKYRLHQLLKRPLSYTLPTVKIIDLTQVQGGELFSDELLGAIAERLEKQEQIILFQNRRGFSSFLQCLKCGELIQCQNCEISMYYHRDREEMQCHYCGYYFPAPRKCPACNSFSFSYGAAGTQKVEQMLKLLFPTARVLRLDSDSSRRQLSSMYKRMRNREVDILLGTQMITKGLDFPLVTLVGIINADISLNIPDFRSAERSFQLLTQVAGRSGRAEKKGEVIIQTYNPEHYAIVNAAKQDFESFAQEELSYRKRLYYPPFSRLARVLYSATDEKALDEFLMAAEARVLKLQKAGHQVLGPAPAPFPKINQEFRRHIIIRAANAIEIKKLIQQLRGEGRRPRGIRETVDIDPASLM